MFTVLLRNIYSAEKNTAGWKRMDSNPNFFLSQSPPPGSRSPP